MIQKGLLSTVPTAKCRRGRHLNWAAEHPVIVDHREPIRPAYRPTHTQGDG
jgi:hypothetical protein